MRTCPDCRSEVPEHERYCPDCDAYLGVGVDPLASILDSLDGRQFAEVFRWCLESKGGTYSLDIGVGATFLETESADYRELVRIQKTPPTANELSAFADRVDADGFDHGYFVSSALGDAEHEDESITVLDRRQVAAMVESVGLDDRVRSMASNPAHGDTDPPPSPGDETFESPPTRAYLLRYVLFRPGLAFGLTLVGSILVTAIVSLAVLGSVFPAILVGLVVGVVAGGLVGYRLLATDLDAPVLRIDDAGITYRHGDETFVPWTDIQCVFEATVEVKRYIVFTRSQTCLAIEVTDDAAPAGTLGDVADTLAGELTDVHCVPAEHFGDDLATVFTALERFGDVPLGKE